METRLVTKAGHMGTEGEKERRDGERKKRETCLNKHKHAERRRGQEREKVREV